MEDQGQIIQVSLHFPGWNFIQQNMIWKLFEFRLLDLILS